jgi:hypothetical protein
MDLDKLKCILKTFADSDDGIETRNGTLMVQIGGDVITADIAKTDGTLYVTEKGTRYAAEQWILRRIAQIDLLAERILANVPQTPAFVTPRGQMLFSLDQAPTDELLPAPNAVAGLRTILDQRPAGTCSVVYLTSDAGEGKTTVIQYLARQQAEAFKRKESDWLLVPISLGGRPFLRFEDVVVAALMNQLRFQRLYFDSFVELVRMGVLIPALDGFEEVFVETDEGDAVSSLGGLIRQFGGDGSVLIAARKAYFEYNRLKTQARLLDALPSVDVSFARVKLDRWDQQQFIDYCDKNQLEDGEGLYRAVTTRVAEDHPLLTRPVLVRRLVDIARNHRGYSFLAELRPESDGFFLRFIDQIIEREATEKWIDKFSDPPQPLLSVKEHRQLLSYVAEEMWISKTSILSAEMMDSLAEIFCDTAGKGPVITRQVRERLKHHALIGSSGGREFSFDHENFRDFFVGQQVGWHIISGQSSDIRRLLRCESMPDWTIDVACSILQSEGFAPQKAIEKIREVAASESSLSFARENVGALAIRLAERVFDDNVYLKELTFPAYALQGRRLQNIAFDSCYFRMSPLAGTTFSSCVFARCEFERLEFEDEYREQLFMDPDCVVRSIGLIRPNEMIDIYDPKKILQLMVGKGFMAHPEAEAIQEAHQSRMQAGVQDEKLAMLQKTVLAFKRSTVVSPATFRERLGPQADRFFDEMVPELKAFGVLQQVTKTSGKDRLQLGIPLSRVADAIAESQGSYQRCLEQLRKTKSDL